MKYCSDCAAPISKAIPDGDNRERFVCSQCDTVFYQNPKIVAGTIPVWQGKVLLCRRAIEPRRGYWTLPAGFMENGESTEQAAIRETWEEACAEVSLGPLFSMITVPHIDQVHLFFLAQMTDGRFSAGEESLEVALFEPQEIPWQQLAFPTVGQTLERYFAGNEHSSSDSATHVFDILPRQALKL
ncbi:NUDIX hydrolase [Bacterioplanes sanyensis]|uniref:NUDIX hydrolase n=1 Tax=Bacterioplanes sanyensis TaxID=1249553 RepID=A0A222FND4_9GAMM|nr:NUDIX hydrolase [Bacterioplanes sanyensis]ASP40076.1 NUDIX hydrolase [Bacterioplanes sanyensis]